jgi:hypothetical protein
VPSVGTTSFLVRDLAAARKLFDGMGVLYRKL